MTLISAPEWTLANDDGTGQSGTPWDAVWAAAAKASIDAVVHSITNPTVSPANLIDEVVTARGNLANLNARLSGVVDVNGNPIAAAGLVLSATAQTLVGAKNLWADSLFTLWPDGDALAPSGWTLSGTGAAIARSGFGGAGYEASAPADTTKMSYGKFAVKITFGSTAAKLTRSVILSTNFPAGLKGRKISVGIRCKASTGNTASIVVDDGVLQTRGGQTGNGTYHSGDAAEHWIYATHTFSASATKLDIYLEVAQAGSAYFSAGVLTLSDLASPDWFPERWGIFEIGQQQRGNATVGNLVNEFRHNFQYPALMVDTRIKCKTPPTTQAIILRPAKTSATYPYSTQPQIAAAGSFGNKSPDGTYANRCFKKDDIFVWDITQVGTGTTGDELNPVFTFMVPMPELDLLGF